MTKYVGVFGGTFDPIHNGHLQVAADAKFEFDLEEVCLIPAGEPWQKTGRVVATPQQRWEMCVLAAKDIPWLVPSRIELDRPGMSYTIDTLKELARPDIRLVLILGADQQNFDTEWERGEEITKYADICVTERWHGVSSTDIRRRFLDKRPCEFIMPPAVIDYIKQNGLYLP